MKRGYLVVGFSLALLFAGGCKKTQSDNDAIRAGIRQHLTGVGTLNLGAMDMDMKNVTINGNYAHAEVEFRPKTGAPPGAGMKVAYNLEKRDGAWVVLKTQAAGGMIEHPAPGQDRQKNQSVYPGSQNGMPNFSDIMNSTGAPAPDASPPGHPPGNSQPEKQDQPSAEKPY